MNALCANALIKQNNPIAKKTNDDFGNLILDKESLIELEEDF